MAIGGSAGYLTVNPTQDYVGQALQGANESFARIRAEKYQKERDKMTADQNLREQRRQDLKDAEEFSAKYPYAAMGDNDKQLVMNLKKTYTEARRDVINTGSERSQALADKAMSNLIRLNESKKAMSLKADEMLKNEKDYNPTSFKKVKDLVAIVGKNLVTRIDDNGNVVSDIVKRDQNTGAIIGIEKENISDGELKQMFEIEPKFDVTGEKGMYAQFRKVLDKPNVVIEPKGNYKVTTTSYPEAESTAETLANEAVNNHSAMYWAMEQIKEDEKGNPIQLDPEDKSNYSNPKVKEIVYDFVKKDLMKKAQTTVSKERDFQEAKFKADQEQRGVTNANEAKRIAQAEAKAKEDGKTKKERTVQVLTKRGIDFENAYKKANDGMMPLKSEYPPNSYVTEKVTTNEAAGSSKKSQEKPAQTQDQWNAAWAKLKKGQSMKGLDGNTYTKN